MSNKKDTEHNREKFRNIKRVSKWITPWGFLSTIYSVHVKGLNLNAESTPQDIKEAKIQNWSGIIASVLAIALAGFLLWKFNSIGADQANSVSIVSAFSLIVFFVLVAKIKSSISNLLTIKREFHTVNSNYVSTKNDKLEIDENAGSILLSRKTFYKFAYILAAAYAFCLVLTPKNFQGLSDLGSSALGSINVTIISLSTSFMLAAILIIRALMTSKDLGYLKNYGAKPISQGYITVNNQIQTIIQYTILGLGVTYIGDMLMASIAQSNLNIWVAAALRPLTMIYMIIFSLKVLKTTVSFSGFQTAESVNSVGIFPILLLKGCKLPPPLENETPRKLPPITIIAACLFGITVWLGSNCGAVAKVTALSALFPIALMLSIQHFAPQIQNKKTTEL